MTTDKTIKSKYQPKQTNVTWIDLSGETPVEKHFINGRWVAVGGGGGGDSSIVINPDEEATETLYKIKADGTVYDADISGKADKIDTPQIYKEDPIQGIPTDFFNNCKMGDILYYNDGYFGVVIKKVYNIPNHINKVVIVGIDSNDQIHVDTYIGPNWEYDSNAYHLYSLSDFATKIYIADVSDTGMLPNALYKYSIIDDTTTFSLAPIEDYSIANVWYWTFETGDTVPTLVFPDVVWTDASKIEEVDGVTMPVIEANKHYEVTIMDGYGTIMSATLPKEEEEE